MEILKYKNGLNNLELGGMKPKEFDLFFSVLKCSDENGNIEVPFSRLKKLTKTENDSNKRFENRLDNMARKFLQATQKIEISEGVNIYFNVLDDITINKNESMLSTKIKDKFLHFLKFDEKEGGYTTIDLEEMSGLSSSYSKILYRIIKQWETVGSKTIEMMELKKIMEIPKSYQMGEIDRRVLKPLSKELAEIFKGFTIVKNKSSVGKGRKVESITFTWQRVERKKKTFEKQEIQTQGTGSKKIYNKELAAEKTIKIEKEIEGLKAEERLAEIVKTNLSSKVVEETVRRVTSNEYEMMYQDYLKANKVEASLFARKGFDIMNKGKYEIIKENKKAL